uniref:DUF6824 domain-containing protein n=1 Tax=Entomoneis paludosa TaxID=265537 RepID=A0A7S2VGL5_9STRA|mmetsp:Transcript_17477/g.36203  ORF Transcript_17477/g.36203 Transcript_17477/m.36203 type:complete len:115 (+) Transcript_17477:89-433(+)
MVYDNDVLLGHEGQLHMHVGNQRYSLLVASHQADFLQATSDRERQWIAQHIVNLVVEENGGQFLVKRGAAMQQGAGVETWEPIPLKKAKETTYSILRQACPDLGILSGATACAI